MVEILDLALRAVIYSFGMDTINSSIKKKIKTNFIISEALFGVAYKKKTKNIIFVIIIIKRSSESRETCFQSNKLF